MSEDSGGNSAGPTFDSFDAAFAADATPASDSVASPSEPDAPDAVVPAEQTPTRQDSASDDRSPFIPRARFDEVNTKKRDLEQWKESHAWAEQYKPEQLQEMQSFYQRATSDTRGFVLQALDELAAHPEHAAAIRSELARRLGTRAAAPAAPPPPTDDAGDVQITDAEGKVVGLAYSADAIARREARLAEKLRQEFAPHVQTLEQIKEEKAASERTAKAESFAKSFSSELVGLPLFKEHQAEIATALRAMRLESDHPAEVRAAAYREYLRIAGPKLSATGTQTVLADLQRKAAASTAVNPSAAPTTTTKRPANFFDPSMAW